MYAAVTNRANILRLLLDEVGCVDNDGISALAYSVIGNAYECFRILINYETL